MENKAPNNHPKLMELFDKLIILKAENKALKAENEGLKRIF